MRNEKVSSVVVNDGSWIVDEFSPVRFYKLEAKFGVLTRPKFHREAPCPIKRVLSYEQIYRGVVSNFHIFSRFVPINRPRAGHPRFQHSSGHSLQKPGIFGSYGRAPPCTNILIFTDFRRPIQPVFFRISIVVQKRQNVPRSSCRSQVPFFTRTNRT